MPKTGNACYNTDTIHPLMQEGSQSWQGERSNQAN